jgi:polar amino acid transport system substrate-binding protein
VRARRFSRRLATVWYVLAVVFAVAAGRARADEHSQVTVAVVRDAPPFSYQTRTGSWSGLTVDLWNMVADELHLDTRFEGMDRTSLVDAVSSGRARFGIGPLTITPRRLERLDFSIPIYVTGLAIAVPHAPRSTWHVLGDTLLSATFLKLIGGLLVLLAVVGTTFWVAERKRNADFSGDRIHGWGSGVWLSIVTMTTVGYGDKAPRTLIGRVIAAVWMFVSIVLISIFTGTVATLLTIDRMGGGVGGFEDLARARVASVKGSAAVELLAEQKISVQQYETIDQAIAALLDGRATALVYDHALLAFLLKGRSDLPISILPGRLRSEYFGIAMQPTEPSRRQVNEALARALDSPAWSHLLFDYLGGQAEHD